MKKYSIEADNYWSFDYIEDCLNEESPACAEYDDFFIAASNYLTAVKEKCDIGIEVLKDVLSSVYRLDCVNNEEVEDEYEDDGEKEVEGAFDEQYYKKW